MQRRKRQPGRLSDRKPRRAGLSQGAGQAAGIVRSTAENGLRTVVVPLPHLHGATICLFVKVGSRCEMPTTNGLSHFLEHMLFRGSGSRPSAYALNHAIEELGGTLLGATHSDFTYFVVSLPAESVLSSMDILADMFTEPAFCDIEVEKAIVREEILECLDEDGRDIDPDDISRRLMFGDHPLGMKITGSAENVARFTEGDLRAYLERYYVPGNMVLCVAGAVDPEQVVRESQRVFRRLGPRAVPPAPAPPALGGGPHFCYVDSQGSQTDVRIAFPTFAEADPRQPALQLLARIIDDGMSTRLHRRICDERGLAYEVFASLDSYDDCGIFDVGAAVEHAKTPDLVRQVLGVLWELRSERVDQAELDKAKRRYRWDLQKIMDSSEAACMHFGVAQLLGSPDELETLGERADRVSTEDVRQVAECVFNRSTLHVSCVGMLGRRLRDQVQHVLRT